MAWSRLVFLDGIWVPTASVSCEWSDKGGSACAITLVPSKESSRILPSTHVHVFHVEAGLAAKKKEVVGLPTDAELPNRSMFAAECAQTIGATYFPEVGIGSSDHWAHNMPFHSMHLRFAGEVISVSEAESAGQGATTQLSCRGYDHLMDTVKAIQLTRGRGTLSDEERGFFGQQDPVFHGTGRNAFFDGIAQILEQSEYGLAETCRRLASVYPARLNTWAAHRFAWTRLADQICAVDNDKTTERLLGTRAFSRYLRDSVQQQYALPLRSVISEILQFVSYRVVAVPTPSFFPLHKEQAAGQVGGSESTEVIQRARDYVRITIPGGRDRGSSRPGGVVTARLYADTSSRNPARNGNGVRFRFEPPSGVNGEGILFDVILSGSAPRVVGAQVGGSTPVTIQSLPSSARSTSISPATFVVGASYSIDLTEQRARGAEGEAYEPFASYEPFVVTAEVLHRPRQVRTTATTSATTPPAPVEDPTQRNSEWARLSSYAIVPHLWWACPPACNVVIPDEILSWSLQDPGAANLTRLLAKIAPGRSGSSRVLMDKFVAPNRLELNQGAADPADDTTDPSKHLYRSEYINGPQADVYYFERLHRLVGDDDWENYLSSFISTEFWNRRLGARSAVLTMRNSIRPVVGAPMLIIRGSGSLELQPTDPAQIHWLARLRALQELRRRLSDARRRLGGNVRAARRLGELARTMYAMRRIADTLPRGAAQPDPALLVNEGGFEDLPASIELRKSTIMEIHRRMVESNTALGVVATPRFEYGDAFSGSITRFDVGTAGAGAEGTIRALVDTEKDKAVQAFITAYPPANAWTQPLLRTWIREIEENTVDTSPCRAALTEDIERLERAIEECRGALRDLATGETEEPSYIGYVAAISESSSPTGNTLTVSLSHVRRVGEDLDWDGLGGDDPEALIAFGEDGYMDEQYRADRIGEHVYKPIYGCGAIADLDIAVAEQELELSQSADVPGLPPTDGSDVELRHPSVCGRNAADGDQGSDSDGSTTSSAARALISAYRAKSRTGARSEDLFRWLEEIRVRATATPTDMYRGLPILMPRTEGRDSAVDVQEGDSAAYVGGERLEGFFARSFLAGDVDFGRVRVVSLNEDGSDLEIALTDDEKDLLQDRVRRVQAYVGSVSSKTFTRTG